jgi:N utilization substance protein A
MSSNELLEALTILEQEKNIPKETLLDAIENSLITACKNHFGKSDNIKVQIDPQSCEYHVFQEKTVVEQVEDPVTQISLVNAKMIDSKYEPDDIVNIEVKSKEFGRIATQNAKNVILQKIREEERKVLYDEYYSKEKDIVTGIVQRYTGKNISINLGKVDAILTESEQVKGESFKPTERIKLYVLEVKSTNRGPKILVSRTHPELVKRLFESEVTEVKDGTVEIKSIAREAGSRTKIAVWSKDPDVDPVGACVGMNGARVNAIVEELRGEKIDIINWNENPAMLIENALSPAKVISVIADAEEKTAKVVVPDYQLSLAIGKEGQNARLAARLTGFKIDIKSETQAREAGDFMDYENDYEDEEYEEEAYEDEAYEEEAYEDETYAGEAYENEAYEEEAYEDKTYEEEYPDKEYSNGEYADE